LIYRAAKAAFYWSYYMSLTNTNSHIITNGASVVIKVSKNTNEPDIILGLTTNASWQENFSIQEAIVIGHFGPVSIDPQSYNCSITLGVFIPINGKMGEYSYNDLVTKNVLEDLPGKDDIFTTGAAGLKLTYQSLEFYNHDTGTTLAKFYGVMLESAGGQIEGNAYARANVTFRALAKEKHAWK
jgi:hypothetical protein